MPSRWCGSNSLSGILLTLVLFVTAAADLPGRDRIEWQPVEGADHYRVEIRQTDTLVMETRSDDPWIPLFLPPGEYLFQIKVINAFGKTASASEWSPLRITAPVVPFIIDVQPRRIPEGSKTVFRATASGIVPVNTRNEGTIFLLENSEGTQIPLDSADLSGGELSLVTSRREPGPGNWSLVMINPDGKQNRMDNVILVTVRHRPKIRKITPDEMAAGTTHNIVVVEVDGLEEGAEILFNGPSEVAATLLNRDEDGVMEYTFNLEQAVPGEYSVTVKNPSGGFDVREKAFEVVPPPPTAEELAAMYAWKVDKREIRPLPEYPNSVRAGWSFSFPVGDTSEYYENSFVGFSLAYSRKFSNELVRRLPGFSGAAWDISFSYSKNDTNFPIIDIYRNQYHFLLGLEYATPFNFPLNLLVRTGAGMGFSIYDSHDYGRDEWIGSFKLTDLDTMDFALRFGAGGRIDIGNRWYVDLTCDITASFYLSRTAWSIQPRLEGGWRW